MYERYMCIQVDLMLKYLLPLIWQFKSLLALWLKEESELDEINIKLQGTK